MHICVITDDDSDHEDDNDINSEWIFARKCSEAKYIIFATQFFFFFEHLFESIFACDI